MMHGDKMNATTLQCALYDRFGRQSELMVPNYTPASWYEADVLRITDSGYMEEFEIKLTLADFKVDALKGTDPRLKYATRESLGATYKPTKHERLAAGDSGGPCRFWFVVPEDLAAKLEIPTWAGLLTARPWGKGARLAYQPLKKAPQLHRQKADPKILEHAKSVFYYRYWNLKSRHTTYAQET